MRLEQTVLTHEARTDSNHDGVETPSNFGMAAFRCGLLPGGFQLHFILLFIIGATLGKYPMLGRQEVEHVKGAFPGGAGKEGNRFHFWHMGWLSFPPPRFVHSVHRSPSLFNEDGIVQEDAFTKRPTVVVYGTAYCMHYLCFYCIVF